MPWDTLQKVTERSNNHLLFSHSKCHAGERCHNSRMIVHAITCSPWRQCPAILSGSSMEISFSESLNSSFLSCSWSAVRQSRNFGLFLLIYRHQKSDQTSKSNFICSVCGKEMAFSKNVASSMNTLLQWHLLPLTMIPNVITKCQPSLEETTFFTGWKGWTLTSGWCPV